MPKIKSIALVTSVAYSLANFRGPLIEELIKCGIKVYALAPDFDEYSRSAVQKIGAIPIEFYLDRTGMQPVKDIRSFIMLRRILSNIEPDLILSYFIKPVIYGSLAANFSGVLNKFSLVAGLGSTFNDLQEHSSFKSIMIRYIASALYKRAFAVCDKVFFQNKDDIEQLEDLGVLLPGKGVHVNGTGVDLTKLHPMPLPKGEVRFLLMARLLREKGICDYVEAARLVKKKYRNVHFVLLGGVDENPSALKQEEVEAWVEEGIIEWPGHVNDVKPWLYKSSVFVLPSYYREGVPRSIQEAMAVGRAIITTDSVGCRETVENNVNGFLVPKRSPNHIASAMVKFIENQNLISSMGRESRRLAEERFDVRQINKKMLSIMGIVPPKRSSHTTADV